MCLELLLPEGAEWQEDELVWRRALAAHHDLVDMILLRLCQILRRLQCLFRQDGRRHLALTQSQVEINHLAQYLNNAK